MPGLFEAESATFAAGSTSDKYLSFVCHSSAGQLGGGERCRSQLTYIVEK